MALQGYHVFPPRPGELARETILHRSHGAISPLGGDAPYRVVDLSTGTEFTGTRDQCIDFVEHAWWRADTAPTSDDHVHAIEHALRLRFERKGGGRDGWERDRSLSSTVAGLHSW